MEPNHLDGAVAVSLPRFPDHHDAERRGDQDWQGGAPQHGRRGGVGCCCVANQPSTPATSLTMRPVTLSILAIVCASAWRQRGY